MLLQKPNYLTALKHKDNNNQRDELEHKCTRDFSTVPLGTLPSDETDASFEETENYIFNSDRTATPLDQVL